MFHIMTTAKMQRAFKEWEKHHREHPEEHLTYRELYDLSLDEAAERTTEYFLKLLSEV